MENQYNNRLQFLHCQTLFQSREEAMAYAKSKVLSLYAEPMVLKYGNEADPSVLLAIGSETNETGQYSENKIFFIDADKLKELISETQQEVEDLKNSLNVVEVDSDTIDLTVEHNETGTTIKGDVRVPQQVVGSEKTNIIQVKENEGLFASVTLKKPTNENRLIFDNGIEETVIDLPDFASAIISISYDPSKECITIQYYDADKNVKTSEIPVGSLIDEWEVENHGHTVTLEKTRVEEGGKDILTADVNIMPEGGEHFNVLKKEGEQLYVSGKDVFDGYVKGTTDEIKSQVTSESERAQNAEQVLRDAINVAENELTSLIGNETSRATQKEGELEEALQNEISKREETDNKLSSLESIVSGKVESVSSENHGHTVTVTVSETDGNAVISSDVNLSEESDNILVKKEGEKLYVSGAEIEGKINDSKASSVQESKTYTDGVKTALETDLKGYTDGKVSETKSELTETIATSVNETLSSSKEYTDGKFAESKEYTDSKVTAAKNEVSSDLSALIESEKVRAMSAETAVQNSVSSLDAKVDNAVDTLNGKIDSKTLVVTSEDVNGGDVAKVYTLTQGGVSYTINIPKDMVVSNGEVVGNELRLTLNNGQVVVIDVTTLMDIYKSGDGINIDSESHAVSVKIDSHHDDNMLVLHDEETDKELYVSYNEFVKPVDDKVNTVSSELYTEISNRESADETLSNAIDSAKSDVMNELSNVSATTLEEAKQYTDEKVSGISLSVDTELSETSENAVQNKVITAELKNKINYSDFNTYSSATKNEIDGKANSAHTHTIDDVDGLQNVLDNKAEVSALDGKVGLDAFNTYSAATKNEIDGKADSAHTHTLSDVAGLQDALDGKLDNSYSADVESNLSSISNDLQTLSGKVIEDERVSSAALNDLESNKADKSDVYTKSESDAKYLTSQSLDEYAKKTDLDDYAKLSAVTEALSTKANSSDVYTKAEVDDLVTVSGVSGISGITATIDGDKNIVVGHSVSYTGQAVPIIDLEIFKQEGSTAHTLFNVLNASSDEFGHVSFNSAQNVRVNDYIPNSEEQEHVGLATSNAVYRALQNINTNFEPTIDSGITMVEGVGGIPAGTSVSDLSGNSISSILERILFPEVNPTVVSPKVSLTSTHANKIYDVSTATPTTITQGDFTINTTNGTWSVGSAGGNTTSGFTNTNVFFGNDPENIITSRTVLSGINTFHAVANCIQGETPKTSYGNNASVDIDGNAIHTYVDGEQITGGTVNVYGTYPVFGNFISSETGEVDTVTLPNVEEQVSRLLQRLDKTEVILYFPNEAETGKHSWFAFDENYQGIKSIDTSSMKIYNPVSGGWDNFAYNEKWYIDGQIPYDAGYYAKYSTTGSLNGAIKLKFTLNNK